jgi:hypothetical protein
MGNDKHLGWWIAVGVLARQCAELGTNFLYRESLDRFLQCIGDHCTEKVATDLRMTIQLS